MLISWSAETSGRFAFGLAAGSVIGPLAAVAAVVAAASGAIPDRRSGQAAGSAFGSIADLSAGHSVDLRPDYRPGPEPTPSLLQSHPSSFAPAPGMTAGRWTDLLCHPCFGPRIAEQQKVRQGIRAIRQIAKRRELGTFAIENQNSVGI